MPLRKNVDAVVLAYIDANLIEPTKFDLLQWWIPSAVLDRAIEDLKALEPPDMDPFGYAEGNAAFAARAEMLRNMTQDERKAMRRKEKVEAALNVYRRQREKDAAAGKPPVLKL